MVDLLTIRKYEFTDGTVILVKIDRAHNEISFVDETVRGVYQPKKWLFAERGVEYMNGWLNILSCMRYAVEDAKKELEAHQRQKADKLIDLMVRLQLDEKTNGKLVKGVK